MTMRSDGGIEIPDGNARPTDFGETLTFLAASDASLAEKRGAWVIVALSLAILVVAAPFATMPLVPLPGFIPFWAGAQVVTALATSILLLGQFLRLRALSLLALSAGYFFVAAIAVPYILSFPGVFATEGSAIGGPQSPAWLYIFWHLGLSISFIAYALLGRRVAGPSARPGPMAAGAAIAVVAAVLLATFTAIRGAESPVFLVAGSKTALAYMVFPAVWLLAVVALVAMSRRGFRSSLDVWMGVVVVAAICDVALSSILNAARYDLGYYLGRSYGTLAIGFVFAVILLETTGLHSRIVDAATRLRSEVEESRRRQRRAEERLRQVQKMEAVGNLTGGLAHDFNNLLAIVIGNIDILVTQKKDDLQVRELGTEALDAALRGADLTKRLLAFARRQPLQPQSVDINQLVSEVAHLLSQTLGEDIEIVLDLDSNLWPAVADPSQLHASLASLASNARDAMPSGGSFIVVTANRNLDADYASMNPDVIPGDYAMIEVSDTGTGMTPDVMSHVFEPFFTTKDLSKGTGLGLSMVYGFVKQSGGHVSVYSEFGIGTTFRLYLPRDVARTMPEPLPSVAIEALAGHGEVILAVEDNAVLRRVVVRQLHELGYRVLEAENAVSAMSVLEREPVDLLFTDVIMTRSVNGVELARSAVSRWPHLRVLLTSGFPDIRLNGNGNGDRLFGGTLPGKLLSKPYRKEELARLIREALAG